MFCHSVPIAAGVLYPPWQVRARAVAILASHFCVQFRLPPEIASLAMALSSVKEFLVSCFLFLSASHDSACSGFGGGFLADAEKVPPPQIFSSPIVWFRFRCSSLTRLEVLYCWSGGLLMNRARLHALPTEPQKHNAWTGSPATTQVVVSAHWNYRQGASHHTLTQIARGNLSHCRLF